MPRQTFKERASKENGRAPVSASSAGAKHLLVLAESSFAVQQIVGFAEASAEEHRRLKNLRIYDSDGQPIPPQEDDTLRMQIVRRAAVLAVGDERGEPKEQLAALRLIGETLRSDEAAYATAIKAVLSGANIAISAQRNVDLAVLAEREAVPYDLIARLYDPETGCDEAQVAKILELPLAIVQAAIKGEQDRKIALGLGDDGSVAGMIESIDSDGSEDDEEDA